MTLKRLTLALALLAAPVLAQPGVVASPRWKPPVANLAALPATGNTIGDTRIALDTMVHYTWDGDSWETAASGGGAGTVTSIAIAVPSEWTVSGSPVTTAGTITIAEATQTANTVYAGPTTGAAAAPGFRALVAADIPASIDADTTGNAATATTATTATSATTAATASDLSCTNCIGGTEIDESTLGEVPTAAAATTATTATTANAVAADSVALGTDTTGNYVAGATASQGLAFTGTEGGTLGLMTCVDGQIPKNVGGTSWACAADATGSGIGGSTGATDNAILRADGTGGSTAQSSPVSIADSASTSVIEHDTTFNGGTVAAFFSSAGGGYTQARGIIGNPLIFSDGSNHVVIKWSTSGWGLRFAGYTGAGFTSINPGQINAASTAGNRMFVVYPDGNTVSVASGGQYQWSSSATDGHSSNDTGFARDSAGVVRATNGSTGIGALLTARSVEANTAGSGTPNVLTATESNKCFTNEGATALAYNQLPTAVAGLHFACFIVADADGIRVTLAAGDILHLSNGQTSTAGGYCESTTQWSRLDDVQAINATDWSGSPSATGWTCDGP